MQKQQNVYICREIFVNLLKANKINAWKNL